MLSVNRKSLIVAVLLHLILLFALLFEKSSDAVPILSFSVTMDHNISVSQNNISATTIANSQKSEKKKEKIEESINKNHDKVVKKQEEKVEAVKSKGDNATNSKQQTAVISNDTPAIFNASYLNNPSPSYPSLSKKRGEQGSVVLSVYINIQGEVEKIEINKSSGFLRLDNTALETVKNWRFVPAKKGGKAEASLVQVPINFVLEKAK